MQKSIFFAKVLRKLKILQKGWLSTFNFTLNKKLGDTNYKIPILRNIGWNNIFEKEPWMTDILEFLLPLNPGIFIDAGVNVGQTLLKLKSIDESRDYFGFEVNPTCISYLKELIKVNDLKNTNLMPFGLSDATNISRLQFYFDNDEDVTASVISDYRPNDQVVRSEYVILSPLDDLEVFSQKIIGIIKIDVEGAELEVLSGAMKILTNDRPLIIIEILPAYSEANENRIKRQNQIEYILKDLNYYFYRIGKDADNQFTGLNRIHSFEINGNISQSDYLLIPAEAAGRSHLFQ